MYSDCIKPVGRRLGAALILLLSASAGASLPASGPIERLQLVGEGELRWFGLSIYEASLWTPEGKFDSLPEHRHVALVIDYSRNIPSSKLVDSARTEWKRIGILDPRTERWCRQVAQIWPDVRPGDRITTLVERGGATVFYFNDREIGRVPDPDFGPALLEIWLHPESRSDKLRRELTGGRR